ncbi:MAG TPA: 16S rRNA methyltransferase [Leucothrix mucor]|nr:16S rRNA methyltransferase [Leucothrix mucor]
MSIPFSQNIAVSGSEACDLQFLNLLAVQLDVAVISPQDLLRRLKSQSLHYLLYLDDNRLELRACQGKKTNAVLVDFLEGKSRHRRLYGGGKGQDLIKAIGLKKIPNATVLDATAGLGGDSFVLATLGCQLTLLERNPIVYHLLNNGLKRVFDSDDSDVKGICSRMSLHNQSAVEYLTQLTSNDHALIPDVIYLDPMFPERKKSAKVKKEMSFFHDIVGDDSDSHELFEIALKCATKRVVVKRPRLAETLTKLKPQFSITGKSTRYDIYHPLTKF